MSNENSNIVNNAAKKAEQIGLFISFEGIDGSGKSTQIQLLKDFLEEQGYIVSMTREPGGTPVGEKIRDILLDPENDISDTAEMLLYASARAQLVDTFIKPKLADREIVIADRFVDSSVAYQAYGRGLGDDVIRVNQPAIKKCMPDLTILLDVPVGTGRNRVMAQAEPDRIEQEKDNFFSCVREGYLRQAQAEPDRIKVIDALQDIDAIQQIIKGYVLDLL